MNKKKSIIYTVFLSFCFVLLTSNLVCSQSYDGNLVERSIVKQGGYTYQTVSMSRKGKRIKAKYFAAKSGGKSVYQRYMQWKKNYPNIILLSSGTYMDDCNPNTYTNPVGICIDNGVTVNKQVKKGTMDGLVVVYATGGIAVSDLTKGNLTLGGKSGTFDIRNGYDKETFIKWSEQQSATVFQTHLLAFKNKLSISSYNSSASKRERRFLAVCKDDNGVYKHVIIQCPEATTLYKGAKRTLAFLQTWQDLEVIFLINLDTGCQNALKVYDKNGKVDNRIRGVVDPSKAINLLVYYYE